MLNIPRLLGLTMMRKIRVWLLSVCLISFANSISLRLIKEKNLMTICSNSPCRLKKLWPLCPAVPGPWQAAAAVQRGHVLRQRQRLPGGGVLPQRRTVARHRYTARLACTAAAGVGAVIGSGRQHGYYKKRPKSCA